MSVFETDSSLRKIKYGTKETGYNPVDIIKRNEEMIAHFISNPNELDIIFSDYIGREVHLQNISNLLAKVIIYFAAVENRIRRHHSVLSLPNYVFREKHDAKEVFKKGICEYNPRKLETLVFCSFSTLETREYLCSLKESNAL